MNHWIKSEESVDVIRRALLSDSENIAYPFIQIGSYPSVYDVEFENRVLKLSTRSPISGAFDASQILHELGHYLIAPSEGLHLDAWGMASPYMAYTGLQIDVFAEGQSPALTEAKVWAWQHILETMCGLSDGNLRPHDEIRYLPGEDMNASLEAQTQRANTLIQAELSSIFRTHSSPEEYARHKIASLGKAIELEAKFHNPVDVFFALEKYRTPTGAFIILAKNEAWFEVFLVTPEDEYFRIVKTRNEKRARAFLKKNREVNEVSSRAKNRLKEPLKINPNMGYL